MSQQNVMMQRTGIAWAPSGSRTSKDLAALLGRHACMTRPQVASAANFWFADVYSLRATWDSSTASKWVCSDDLEGDVGAWEASAVCFGALAALDALSPFRFIAAPLTDICSFGNSCTPEGELAGDSHPATSDKSASFNLLSSTFLFLTWLWDICGFLHSGHEEPWDLVLLVHVAWPPHRGHITLRDVASHKSCLEARVFSGCHVVLALRLGRVLCRGSDLNLLLPGSCVFARFSGLAVALRWDSSDCWRWKVPEWGEACAGCSHRW